MEDALALVGSLRAAGEGGELVRLLDERHPIHIGRTAAEAERLRGSILAALAAFGEVDEAVGYILEELESGIEGFPVAAAARALRASACPPEGAADLLRSAIQRFATADDAICFQALRASADSADTTILVELVRALAHVSAPHHREALEELRETAAAHCLSPRVKAEIDRLERETIEAPAAAPAPCCAAARQQEQAKATSQPRSRDSLGDLEVQDQSGATSRFDALFAGRPAAIAFFFTRCMNPEKCSLTVSRLARLYDRLEMAGMAHEVTVAGISYDPEFDIPQRLRGYGADRGMRFGERCRLLRAREGFDRIAAHFELGFGKGPVTVNRHRLELFVIDAEGRPVRSFLRRRWDEDEVFNALLEAVAPVPA